MYQPDVLPENLTCSFGLQNPFQINQNGHQRRQNQYVAERERAGTRKEQKRTNAVIQERRAKIAETTDSLKAKEDEI